MLYPNSEHILRTELGRVVVQSNSEHAHTRILNMHTHPKSEHVIVHIKTCHFKFQDDDGTLDLAAQNATDVGLIETANGTTEVFFIVMLVVLIVVACFFKMRRIFCRPFIFRFNN